MDAGLERGVGTWDIENETYIDAGDRVSGADSYPGPAAREATSKSSNTADS